MLTLLIELKPIYYSITTTFFSGDTEVRQTELSAYVERLQTEISESVSLLQRQFQLVRSFEPTELEQSAGLKPANVAKNRTGAPLPTDSARVLLMPKPGEDGSDYINASFLPGLCHYVNNIK